jgi:hypothetical protein
MGKVRIKDGEINLLKSRDSINKVLGKAGDKIHSKIKVDGVIHNRTTRKTGEATADGDLLLLFFYFLLFD